MACHIPPTLRDLLVRVFRAEVYRRAGFVEFPHQASLRLATEGLELSETVVPEPPESVQVLDPKSNHALKPVPVKVMEPCNPQDPGAFLVGETSNHARYEWRLAVPRLGTGVIAHRASDMAGFKGGKSKGIGLWAAGFACLPGATVEMVGIEYKTSEHEFNYLLEALLSGKHAPVKGKPKHLYNDVRAGRMFLELDNRCTFECRSYQQKDTLRGGQMTAYLFNEAYQLPGLESFTGNAQNLRAEKGFAVWTTTPDRPWVQVLHRMAHGKNPDWFCVCGNTGYVNPFTFELTGFMADAPDWETIGLHAPQLLPMCLHSGMEPGRLMSKEKFLIAWLGKMGEFVGRVYEFQQGAMTFSPSSHPQLWQKAAVERYVQVQGHISALRAHAPAL